MLPVFQGKRPHAEHGEAPDDFLLSVRAFVEPVPKRRLDDRAVIELHLQASAEHHQLPSVPELIGQVVILGELGVEITHDSEELVGAS